MKKENADIEIVPTELPKKKEKYKAEYKLRVRMSSWCYNWFVQKWNEAVENKSDELTKQQLVTFSVFLDDSIMSLVQYRVQGKEPDFL